MSVGPLGIPSSAAATPLAQTHGSESDRARLETAQQARAADAGRRAESAAGVGQTGQDEQAADRDADGRRLWERPAGQPEEDQPETGSASPTDEIRSKDPTGTTGTILDLNA